MIDPPLPRREYVGLVCLLAILVAFGVLVEIRSAFLTRPHTDLGVYLRAAWAVREGNNPYEAVDDNGWHYTYPLPFAILLVPFAHPPHDAAQTAWTIPFPVSVALWYLASVVALFWASHALCRVLDETRTDGVGPAGSGSRRFWWVRSWPIWICLPAVGSTLARGQVNTFLLALLAAFIVAVMRGRRATAGWWLAAATCFKVIPAFLLLYPLYRRDWRMLGHFTLGMIVGVVLIPTAVFGPERALSLTTDYVGDTLLPGLTNKQGRATRELTSMNGTDNQSIQAIIHNVRNFEPSTRPDVAASGTKLGHVLIGLALLVATFVLVRRIPDERYRTFFLLSELIILMVALTPVNHLHYMVLALPAVLGLVYRENELRRHFSWRIGLVVVVVLHIVSGIYPRFPLLPGYQAARDLGVTMLGTLLVWGACLAFRTRDAVAPAPESRSLFVRLDLSRRIS